MEDWEEYGKPWPNQFVDSSPDYCIGCKWEGDCPEVDDDTEIYDCPNKVDK